MDNLIYQKIWRKVVRIEIKCLISVIGSKILKKDNINTLTKQTLFDHLNNVAMSSNNNTRSAKINSVSNTIENQLSKQTITKLFKNLEEAEAEELNIDSAAQEVEEMLKNYRNMKSCSSNTMYLIGSMYLNLSCRNIGSSRDLPVG